MKKRFVKFLSLTIAVFLVSLFIAPSVAFAQDNINKLPRELINPGSLEVSSDTDNSQVAAFVTRFYQLCLSRDPDSAGLNTWIDWLESGAKTGADVAYGFVFSDEFIARNVSKEEYLTILYRAFFNREPDSSGYNTWLDYLSTGKSRQWVLAGFINSQEFKNLCAAYGINPGSLDVDSDTSQVADFVTRFYQLCLSRDPDAGGLNAWVDWLESGAKTGADVAHGFVFSEEFIQRNVSNSEYVTILYRAFFNREPDSSGYNIWLGYLNTGKSRQWVLAGFINSQEFKNLCSAYGINPGSLILESKIAFGANRDGNYEIYIMNVDGSGQVNLTNNPEWDGEPCFSPNGYKIAFTSNRDGNREIYVMNVYGSGQVNLTNNPEWDGEPCFSPDGSKIAFVSNRDGNREIYVMNVDGSGLVNLTNNLAWDWLPSFSPDGSKIAFVSNRDGNPEIYIMDADGSGQVNLTKNSDAYDLDPCFSYDGYRIAFTSNRDGKNEIYIMNVDGSGLVNLTNNPEEDLDPRFSPGGSKIAFTSNRDGNFEIYTMNVDGSGQTRLTNNPADDLQPCFSP